MGAPVPRTTPIQINTKSGRFYDIEGEPVPSVTHVLSCIAKPALVPWASRLERTLAIETALTLHGDPALRDVSRAEYRSRLDAAIGRERAHRRATTKATDIGTEAHHAIERRIRVMLGLATGPERPISEAALWSVMAWEDWAKSVAFEPILTEAVVWSRAHGYAGTMDVLARVTNDRGVAELVVCDWKTSKAIYEESDLQSVAYQAAVTEMGHDAPVGGYVVRLPKKASDPEFEVRRVPPAADLWPTWLAALRVWRWWYAAEQRSRARWEAARGG